MLTIVIDAQAGSCGKGKVAAFLALKNQPSVVAAGFGPNAGHTVWLGEGSLARKLVFRHLPAGSVCKSADILIGAAAIIDLEVLNAEILAIETAGIPIRDRLRIHPRAVVITDKDKMQEAQTLRGISSTMKGVGAAQASKIMRQAMLAGDYPSLQPYTKKWSDRFLLRSIHQESVMLETSQGFDLCLNHGVSYPFCTGRQINAAQVLADFGIPLATSPVEIVGVVRPYPIRVGNISATETSGPYAPDTKEISWEKVAKDAMMPPEAVAAMLEQEKTTVTQRQRRVFTFSWERFKRFCEANQPTMLALNFADQITYKDRLATKRAELSIKTQRFLNDLEQTSEAAVGLIGTGPLNSQMIEK
jgi:adenylosuccinate synthase